jgi:hypothetical protein
VDFSAASVEDAKKRYYPGEHRDHREISSSEKDEVKYA